jgi:hypothetical protein
MPCEDSGLNYWPISAVNEKELQEFEHLFEQQAVPHSVRSGIRSEHRMLVR